MTGEKTVDHTVETSTRAYIHVYWTPKIKIVKSKDTTCQIDTGDRLYEIIINPGQDIYNGVRVRKE